MASSVNDCQGRPGGKRLSISFYSVGALAAIVMATILRLMLIAQGFPGTTSDEGTIGLMAMHIAYRGEWPIFFYGQGYMGPFEAYLGAALFHLFGPSLFALRLGLVLVFACFLASTYLLTSLLYTKKWALLALLFIGMGTGNTFAWQLLALGGYPETLFFSSLIFLLAAWLALTCKPGFSLRQQRQRYVVYGCWGLLVGLGLWTDTLVGPFALMAGLLLVRFCWSEMRRWAEKCLLLGLALGLAPVIVYNIAMPLRTLTDIWNVHQTSYAAIPIKLPFFLQNIVGTFLVSIPAMIEGYPLCAVSDLPPFGPGSADTLRCTIVHSSWSAGYLTLLALASVLAFRGFVHQRLTRAAQGPFTGRFFGRAGAITRRGRSGGDVERGRLRRPLSNEPLHPRAAGVPEGPHSHIPTSPAPRCNGSPAKETSQGKEAAVQHFARLMLLSSAALTIALFALSPVSAQTPAGSARYLIGLLLCTPAVLWPLWSGIGAPKLKQQAQGWTKHVSMLVLKGGLLLFVGILILLGTINAFSDMPITQASNRQQDALIAHLYRLHATHIYSEYDTCDRLIFLTHEQIICSVLDTSLRPGVDRYLPYRLIVRSDPHAAYVFPEASPQAIVFAQRRAPSGRQYQRFDFDGYVIYQPVLGGTDGTSWRMACLKCRAYAIVTMFS